MDDYIELPYDMMHDPGEILENSLINNDISGLKIIKDFSVSFADEEFLECVCRITSSRTKKKIMDYVWDKAVIDFSSDIDEFVETTCKMCNMYDREELIDLMFEKIRNNNICIDFEAVCCGIYQKHILIKIMEHAECILDEKEYKKLRKKNRILVEL